MTTDKTFMKITNRDIFNKIEENQKMFLSQHFEVCKRLDITNGKVKLNRWIATTALSLTLIVLGFLIQHIAKN
jgi:hypothetical protein